VLAAGPGGGRLGKGAKGKEVKGMSKRRAFALGLACTVLSPALLAGAGTPAHADLTSSPAFSAAFADGQADGVVTGTGWSAAVVAGGGSTPLTRTPSLTATLTTAASGVAALTWTPTVPAGRWFLAAQVTGTPGRAAQVTAAGSASAPLQVDTVWQNVGLSITQSSAGPLRIELDPRGTWRSGDRVSVANLQLAPSRPSVTTVRPGTRIMEVNGQPFTAKGYLYWPAAIGEDLVAQSWADPVQCQQDARLLHGAGATLLRAAIEYATPLLPQNYIACLDSFAANGIGILWAVNPPYGSEKPASTGVPSLQQTVDRPLNDATLIPLYEQWIAMAVHDFGSHPATYFWHINNEADGSVDGTCSTRDLWLGHQSPSPQVGLADQLLAYTKSLDPSHLVTTVVGGCSDHVTPATPQGLGSYDLPHLDFWGDNSYVVGCCATQSYYDNLKLDPRPVMFTEFGEDRYTCRAATLAGIVCDTSMGSGEDQASQGRWDARAWSAIAGNLATPANPQGAVFGGTDFMYSDLWWYGLPFVGFVTVTHDTIGSAPWPDDDGVQNFKWWGVNAALPPGATQMRYTSLGFDAFADQWTTPASQITGVLVSFAKQANGLCQARVAWTTSAPATSQLLGGVDGEVFNGGGAMLYDNTLFGDLADDGAFTTAHALHAADLVPGGSYKFAPRSFTPDGHSRTTAPIITPHIAC
jgi:hypothetical protein